MLTSLMLTVIFREILSCILDTLGRTSKSLTDGWKIAKAVKENSHYYNHFKNLCKFPIKL